MWDFIECLLKVSVYNINLNSFVQVICGYIDLLYKVRAKSFPTELLKCGTVYLTGSVLRVCLLLSALSALLTLLDF